MAVKTPIGPRPEITFTYEPPKPRELSDAELEELCAVIVDHADEREKLRILPLNGYNFVYWYEEE